MSNEWNFKIELKDDTVFGKIEKEFGVAFPEELKEFIMNNNAASPDANLIVIDGIERVYEETLSFNEEETEASTFDSAMKSVGNSNYIPFAKDPFGNYFCYSIITGMISFFDQDEELFFDSGYTFEEFINSLYK